jgi:hypothetical protein
MSFQTFSVAVRWVALKRSLLEKERGLGQKIHAKALPFTTLAQGGDAGLAQVFAKRLPYMLSALKR